MPNTRDAISVATFTCPTLNRGNTVVHCRSKRRQMRDRVLTHLVPALNHLTLTNGKLEGIIAVKARIELLAGGCQGALLTSSAIRQRG